MEEAPAQAANERSAEVEAAADNPQVTIPVEFYLPENVPTYYSDSATIIHSAHEFVVSFLLTEFPLAISKEDLERVELIKRRCVVRVIQSPAQFQSLVTAMQNNLDKYLASHEIPGKTG